MKIKRALLIIIDSLGIGSLADADQFGDAGADTLGHIAAWCARPQAAGGRGRALDIPNLQQLGMANAAALARGAPLDGVDPIKMPIALWGAAAERSTGKDTVSGHWEMCGLPVDWHWGMFDQPVESFPPALLEAIAQEAGIGGFIGRCHASGTEIINRLGAEHERGGLPIAYTSADSVLQIAAHEQAFGLDRLYQLCIIARRHVDPLGIGRVIARPFIGDAASGYQRSTNRRDYAVPPPRATLLDAIVDAGGTVHGVGKIHDIFAGHGVSKKWKANGLAGLMQTTSEAFASLDGNGLVFTNLVDFDQEYGHRRDVAGYAGALEELDAMLPALLATLGPDDLLVLSADHGNDPTWPGSDHTREFVPILAHAPGLTGASIGIRDGLADIGQSIARWLEIPAIVDGSSFLEANHVHTAH